MVPIFEEEGWAEALTTWVGDNLFVIILTILAPLLMWRFSKRVNAALDALYETMSPQVQVKDPQRLATKNLIRWLFYTIALALILYFWGIESAFYATLIGLSITGLVMGLASRDILANIFAGLVLTVEKPFTIGDMIKSGEFKGRVRGLNMRSTLLETEEGVMVRLPNSQFISLPLINFSRHYQDERIS